MPKVSRRSALRTVFLSALGASLLPAVRARAQAGAARSPGRSEVRFRLGLATYSLRDLSIEEVIAVMKDLRLENAAPFRSHFPWGKSDEEVAAAAAKFREAGIHLTGSGVFKLANDEAAVRAAFDNARAAELDLMICSPEPAALPLVEKYVRAYDQKLAIHNHGPEDKLFPTPRDILTAIQPLDPRIGICLDVAHTARAGFDPIEMIHLCAPRLVDLHLRDSIAPVGAMKDIPCEVGAGHLDIIGILSALIDLEYTGVVALEYGKTGNVVAGLSESLGFTRGALAVMDCSRSASSP